MKLLKVNEGMTLEQKMAIDAIETLRETIRNKDHFSDADITQVQSEIKRVHSMYKIAFKKTAFTWQVDNYTIQMALENEYRFIFSHKVTMTWTQSRWKFALLTELAIRHYSSVNSEGLTIEAHGFQVMCFWLFFQYFNVSVFTGTQCMEVFNTSFQIVKDADDAILQCVQTIKQWRIDNDGIIRSINSKKAEWRQEKARMNRLLHGRMKLNEVEIYHILHWSYSGWSFDFNVRYAAKRLGVSVKGVKKIIRDHNIQENSYWGIVTIYKDKADIKYEKEYKWAYKVIHNLLSKKERREFWRRHSIPNPKLMFRTFTNTEPDLIPAANPLLTTEECVPPAQEQPLFIPSYKLGLIQPMEGLFS